MKQKSYREILDLVAADSLKEKANLWPHIAAKLERKSIIQILRARPVLIVILALLALIMLTGVVYAIGRSLGYIPGIGLVENVGGMRVLAEPVSLTREGISLTLEEVLAYPDHVEISYRVEGISNTILFDPDKNIGDDGIFCLENGAHPLLLLPDGTSIPSDPMVLGGLSLDSGYSTGYSFPIPIPTNISGATLSLDCLKGVKRGAALEDWILSFNLVQASDGMAIGEPVVEPLEIQTVHLNGITLSVDKVVSTDHPIENGMIFYLKLEPDEANSSQIFLVPYSAYVIDVNGQRFPLFYNNKSWSPFEPVESWDMQTIGKPANGPLTLVLDQVWAFYKGNDVKFEFTPGNNTQVGQIWPLNIDFNISGFDVKVVSAKRIARKDYGVPNDLTEGFEFQFESVDPNVSMYAQIHDCDPEHPPQFPIGNELRKPVFTNGFTYSGEIPASPICIVVDNLSVVRYGPWTIEMSVQK